MKYVIGLKPHLVMVYGVRWYKAPQMGITDDITKAYIYNKNLALQTVDQDKRRYQIYTLEQAQIFKLIN